MLQRRYRLLFFYKCRHTFFLLSSRFSLSLLFSPSSRALSLSPPSPLSFIHIASSSQLPSQLTSTHTLPVEMQDLNDDQAGRRNAATSNNKVQHSHPQTPRKVRRNSGDDTDGELNDGYGEDYSAHRPSRPSRRSNNGLG
ncbi:MAG: hypothetical protein J3R72DRAFT_436598 [Linnemannia gamsii]|nr:MAG: hypothetical protein J3R72DRAFT_436598 [Linnemannia gamsii]